MDDSHSWLPQDFGEQMELACRILRFAYHSQAAELQKAVAEAQQQLEERTALVQHNEEELSELQTEVSSLQAQMLAAEREYTALQRDTSTVAEEVAQLGDFRTKVLEVVDQDAPRRSLSQDSETSQGRRHTKLREVFEALRLRLSDASYSACMAQIKGYSKGEKAKSEALARLRLILKDETGIYAAIAAVL